MAYHRQQGVDTAIVRIFNTYGPRMRRNDGRAIPDLHPPGARGQAAHRLRRRLADAQLLLRRRPDPRPHLLATSGEHLPVNLGNPTELTMLELAQAVHPGHGLVERDRLRGAADRRPAGAPARHHARAPAPRLGARDRARRGPARWLASLGRDAGAGLEREARRGLRRRRGRRRSSRATARPAHASRLLRVGIYDDAQMLYGAGRQTFPLFKQLHVQEVRLNLYWGGPYGVAKTRPAHPTDPTTRPTTGTLYDRTVNYAHAERACRCSSRSTGRRAGRTADAGRTSRRRPRSTCATSRSPPRSATAASMIRGPTARSLPAVTRLARLERAEQPRLPHAAVQAERGGKWVDRERDRTTRRSATRSTAASTRRCSRARVACGVTAPRGNNNPTSRGRLSRRSPSCAR